MLGEGELGLAGVVDLLDFGIRGEVGGELGDGFEVALGDGGVVAIFVAGPLVARSASSSRSPFLCFKLALIPASSSLEF